MKLGLLGLVAFILASALPAYSDWSSTSSAQLVLRVDAASGEANAVGSAYSVLGNGLAGTPVLNNGVAPASGLSLQSIAAGAAFQMTMSQKTADTVGPVNLANTLPAYSEIKLNAGGASGSLSGEIISPTRGSANAGGPGTSATLTQSNTFSVF